MAADATIASEQSKSCCAALKERLSKMDEKRNALRLAVKLLDDEVNKLQAENLELKRACEQERMRADRQSEEKEKESRTRNELEKEVCNLKAEITALQNRGGQDEDGDELLRSCALEREVEISRLKELLEKEKKRGDLERKKAETEKVKGAEAWKLVKEEKRKAEEEKKLTDIERKKAEECRVSLESLKLEAKEAKSKLVSEKLKTEEANRKAEAEKQKANREKKRADLEMVKVVEQRKCIEVERKKVMDEKSHADHLSQQLEEEKQKGEVLQKEMEQIIAVGRAKKCHLVPPDGNVKTEASNEKVLKGKLKLEKKKVKHAKRIAKQEKERNNLLQKELYLLKQDAIQFSRRLDILDGCFSRGMEGIDGLAKIGNSPELRSNSLNNRILGTQVCDLHSQSENELIKTRYTSTDAFDHIGSRVECTATLFPVSGGSFTQPISGISSELESLIGGSVRNESQNSAIYSTSTSFSDRQLMGSQGRGVFSATTSSKLAEDYSRQGSFTRLSCEVTDKRYRKSTKLAEENSRQGSASREVTEKRYCKNPAVVAEGNGGSLVDKPSGTPSLRPTLCDRSQVLDRASGHGRKKTQDAPESVMCFKSEDKKLDFCIKDTHAPLQDVLGPKSDMPASICSQSDGNSQPLLLHSLYSKKHKSRKNRKVDLKQKLVSQYCGHNDKMEHKDKLEIEGSRDAQRNTGVSLPVTPTSDAYHACRDETISTEGDQSATLCFEDMFRGDYMKLLELDNDDDEERFRIAIEMPLSPTLPEIEFPKLGISEVHNPSHSVKRSLPSLMIEEDNLVMHRTSDVIGSDFFNAAEPRQTSVCNALASGTTSEGPSIQQPEVCCIGSNGDSNWSIPKYCVVFSNMKDEDSISRIFCARENCISQSSMVSQTHWVISEFLLALALERGLLLEEKACVFFSLLLYNFSVGVSSNSRIVKTGDAACFSDFLTAQLNQVISDVETRYVLLELCQRDILFSLIEDFLVDGRVLVYNDVHGEAFIPCASGSEIAFPGCRDLFVSRIATADQLEAGGIILASICLATDYIGFICEASYNILRMCKGDSFWILTVLHIFASVCRKKYFQQRNYSLVMTSIKSVVLFLESGSDSVGTLSSSCLHSARDNQLRFSPCVQCPFAEGALCVDKVLLLLMEKLEDYAISVIRHQHPKKSITSSIYTVQAQIEGDEKCVGDRNDTDGLNMSGNVSCCLVNGEGVVALKAECGAESTLCQLSDIVSLVELLSCHMSWDWSYSNIIPRLLKLLDSCINEEVSAAILVLIGQLRRLGIDAGGYVQKGLEELRFSLSTFLDANITGERGLPFQFSAVHALIDLLPFGFEEVIQKNMELSVDTSQSAHAEAIRKWFSQLSKEQQDLSMRLFQTDDEGKNR
ncbi:uncharacterized protein LOC131220870 isoform X2 [Magnolia sinica]|uniref:uncharacterized protein LOC131220870 isoform X2 n=1 Tax=Magnolia sinica TaxID=86752 RepID=UPI00265844DD|nr:uncharacterized protein LOC131220870 isoform X2 [Magnolia sinica]